jgi:hypothetical protein
MLVLIYKYHNLSVIKNIVFNIENILIKSLNPVSMSYYFVLYLILIVKFNNNLLKMAT